MADAIFAQPKLAEIYDLLDSPDRPDLAPYVAMADEFSAHSVIDLGCGTGMLACRLAALGKEVVGIDPAAASLDVAKRKEHAGKVALDHWECSRAQRITCRSHHDDRQCGASICDGRGVDGYPSCLS